MAYDPAIGSGRVPGRRPAPLNPTDRIADAVATLRDSRRGLRTAGDAIDDPAVTEWLVGMAERRERYATGMIDVAAGAGIILEKGVHGKAGEAIRRGWMRLEDAVAGDEAVLETVMNQERTAAQELANAVGEGLPADLERELRSVSSSILEEVQALEEMDLGDS